MPVNAGGRLEVRRAPLAVSRLSATSPDHPLALEADLCRVSWPAGILPDVRFVPDRWLTTQISGDEALLARLPHGPREERRDGIVRWTFTGQEIDQGDVDQHFRKVATAMGLGGVPYR